MIGSKMIQFLIFITMFFSNYSFIESRKYLYQSYNVSAFGAEAGGDSDCTEAFLDAWKAACDSNSSRVMIYVPEGQYWLSHAVFDGSSCEKTKIIFKIDGTLLAPSDYNDIGDEQNWLVFYKVNRVTIKGGGEIDGQGANLWKCRQNKHSHGCPKGVTTLGIYHSNDVTIKGVTFLDSQMFHSVVYGSENVNYIGVNITAPANSPNTDGIHVELSSGVSIMNTIIATGDDCVSMGQGSVNVLIDGVTCGPGHGISIGSLCKSDDEKGVQNVTVRNTKLSGTQNGLRIKTWSSTCNTAFVRDVLYQNIDMVNVQNAIMITKNYCPSNSCTSQDQSTVDIRNIEFDNIKGLSSSKTAVTIDCRGKYSCHNIKLNGIELRYNGTDDQAKAYCSNALVYVTDDVEPMPQNCY